MAEAVLFVIVLVVAAVSSTVGPAGGVVFASMALILPGTAVVPVHAAVQAGGSAFRFAALRRMVDYRTTRTFILSGLVGIVPAALVVSSVDLDPVWLRLGLGLATLVPVFIGRATRRLREDRALKAPRCAAPREPRPGSVRLWHWRWFRIRARPTESHMAPPAAMARYAPGFPPLAKRATLVSLSNADSMMSADIARFAGIAWHRVLGAEPVRTYKPRPEVFLHAVSTMGLDVSRIMMVAAHNRDLEVAHRLGMRTALVVRRAEHGPGQTTDVEPSGPWDVVCHDLLQLADLLGPPIRGPASR